MHAAPVLIPSCGVSLVGNSDENTTCMTKNPPQPTTWQSTYNRSFARARSSSDLHPRSAVIPSSAAPTGKHTAVAPVVASPLVAIENGVEHRDEMTPVQILQKGLVDPFQHAGRGALALHGEDIETASQRMTKGRESFAPDPANAAVYGLMHETVYHTIRDATDPLLERAYPIFREPDDSNTKERRQWD